MHGRHRELVGLLVEGHGGHHRQIAPRVVVAIEEAELLLAVRRVVGGVEVDGNPRGAPFSRRRWVSITVSASTCARSRNSHQLTAFSNRDRVGCDARARQSPLSMSGSRQSAFLDADRVHETVQIVANRMARAAGVVAACDGAHLDRGALRDLGRSIRIRRVARSHAARYRTCATRA